MSQVKQNVKISLTPQPIKALAGFLPPEDDFVIRHSKTDLRFANRRGRTVSFANTVEVYNNLRCCACHNPGISSTCAKPDNPLLRFLGLTALCASDDERFQYRTYPGKRSPKTK
jgi:hypothetical protein